jgi:hypothetical protein
MQCYQNVVDSRVARMGDGAGHGAERTLAAVLARMAAFVLVALVVSACHSSPGTAGPPPGPSTTLAATTTVAPTTIPPTTVYKPHPQSSPAGAAAALIDAWSKNDRAAAAQVAAPGAVTTLFASVFPTGYIQDRGCSAPADGPATCTYRNTRTEGIYQLYVSPYGGGWYVSSATAES